MELTNFVLVSLLFAGVDPTRARLSSPQVRDGDKTIFHPSGFGWYSGSS
jgi:hypothetical protein